MLFHSIDPAQIDRTSLLPPTSPTKIVAGAGRTNQSISVRNGNTIELHCPYSGTEKPSTTWYRVGPSGVLMSVNSSIPDVTIIDASNDLILTFSSFTPSLAGTYRCVTTNNAGDDEGNVILKSKFYNINMKIKSRLILMHFSYPISSTLQYITKLIIT